MSLVELPWPPKELNPNARVHHYAKARAAKHYREAAYWLTVAAQALPGKHLDITFLPPDARRRDLDNMLASAKNALDGLADAIGVNDREFTMTLRRGEPVKDGRVIVSIRTGEAVPIGELARDIVNRLAVESEAAE